MLLYSMRSSGALACLIFVIGLAVEVGSYASEPEDLVIALHGSFQNDRPQIVKTAIPKNLLPESLRAAVEQSEAPLGLATVAVDRSPESSGVLQLQLSRAETSSDHVQLVGRLQAGTTTSTTRRFYRVELSSFATTEEGGSKFPWDIARTGEGHLRLSFEERPVLQYNVADVTDVDHPNPLQARNAYLHPVYSPEGLIVTGDYSDKSHPHHRGIFLAYTKTERGDLHPDFWNLQRGSGRVRVDNVMNPIVGPLTARLEVDHRWEALRSDDEPVTVLREHWVLEAIDVQENYWLIDLTATQEAINETLTLPRYRYGGMAYRGPDSFFPNQVLDVLTSEGFDQVQGDQKPARWVDLSGPVKSGSDQYVGVAILDHPDNINHPTPARIHPTRLPFFSYVPSHDHQVVFEPGEPLIFRYRIVIHDGHPDGDLNERLWQDFASPLSVELHGAE